MCSVHMICWCVTASKGVMIVSLSTESVHVHDMVFATMATLLASDSC